MSVVNVWCGAVTDTSIRIIAKVTGSTTRVAIDIDPALSSPTYYGPVAPTAQGIASFDVVDLEPSTQYYYAIEDDSVLDSSFPGKFRTMPPENEPADFFFSAIGDAGLSPSHPGEGDVLASSRLSNHIQFDYVRFRDPDFVVHVGDMHYYDLGSDSHGINGGASADNYRRAYDDVLLQPRQHRLYREVPIAYVWDDHDYGPNNSDRTHSGRANARTVYRERVPHYDLPAGSGDNPIYQSWQVGRVLFIASDVRSERDPNSDTPSPTKTMLGAAQKQWMESVLSSTTAEALVWIMPGQWMDDDGADTWFSFGYERWEMVELFGDLGWLNRMCVVSGDTHALAIDTGKGNKFGGFPVYHVASVDATPSALSDLFDTGSNMPTRNARGEFSVRDYGHTIEIHGALYTSRDLLFRAHPWQAHVGTPVLSLDYSAGHLSPPLEPTDDDQNIHNDVTASRTGGSSRRVMSEDGPLSVLDPPEGVGLYTDQVTVNTATDDQLYDQAGWRVHLGTVDEPRVPSVRVDLAANPELIDSVAEIDSGDRVEIANLPTWAASEPIALLAQGYTETISSYSWDVSLSAAPGRPWDIAQVADSPADAGPAGPNRVDTTGSALVSDVDSDTTSLLVLTEQDETTDGRAIWMPSTGPASGITFVDAKVAVNSSASTLLQVDVPSVSDGDLMIAFVGSLGTGVDITAPAGWTQLLGPQQAGGTSMMTEVWYRVASSEPANYQFSFSGAAKNLAAIVAYSGVDVSNPIVDVASDGDGTDTTGPFQGPSVDASEDSWVVHAVFGRVNNNSASWSASGGTERVDQDTGGTGFHAQVAVYDLGPVADGSYDFTYTCDQTSVNTAMWALALKPAESQPGPYSADFPFDVKVGGEQMRVMNIRPYLFDDFERTETDTWGTTVDGLEWIEEGGSSSDRAVANGAGIITLASSPATTRRQFISPVLTDCDVIFAVTPDQVATGNSFLPAALFRHQDSNNYYRMRVHLTTSGTVTLSVARTGTTLANATSFATYGAGTTIWCRARIVGQRILARVWEDSREMEPRHWDLDYTVTEEDGQIEEGQVGIAASAFSTNTNVNPSLAFEYVEFYNPQRFRVTRSINGITKSHQAGTSVRLARPAVLGL